MINCPDCLMRDVKVVELVPDGKSLFRCPECSYTWRRPESMQMFHAYIGEERDGRIKITTDKDCLSPELIRLDERVFPTETELLSCAMGYRARGYKVWVDTGSIFQDYR